MQVFLVFTTLKFILLSPVSIPSIRDGEPSCDWCSMCEFKTGKCSRRQGKKKMITKFTGLYKLIVCEPKLHYLVVHGVQLNILLHIEMQPQPGYQMPELWYCR